MWYHNRKAVGMLGLGRCFLLGPDGETETHPFNATGVGLEAASRILGEMVEMKFIHLSDLHLGKRIHEFSMLEDQRYILEEILSIADKEQPQGVLIAGDVYDKSVPSTEAVALLDEFLVLLAERNIPVFLISGNHDSPERMAFGGRLMEKSGIHIAPIYNGRAMVYTMEDKHGPVHIHLLPFVKPVQVRRYFPQAEVQSYTQAVQTAIAAMELDRTQRNILVTHQFVAGAAQCDSEERWIGGSDQVDVSVLDGFDYVALGHLHGPQWVGRETVRYCGTPLKYSFSEVHHRKSVTVVELEKKGEVKVRSIPLVPKRDLVELRGTYQQLTFRGFYHGTSYPQDYLHITLLDEQDIPEAMTKLRVIYPYLMKLDYDNRRTRAEQTIACAQDIPSKTPLEWMDQFYRMQHGQDMEAHQRALAEKLMAEIWEDEV